MTADKPALEFVNDWSALEQAIGYLCACEGCNDGGYAVEVIRDYVPRLLTQYASLLELSFALTEGWDQYAAHTPPTGLYLPEHR